MAVRNTSMLNWGKVSLSTPPIKGEEYEQLYSFLTSALNAADWLIRSGCSSRGKNRITHWTGGLGAILSKCVRFGEEINAFGLPGFEPLTMQLVF
jgi:hypothetical protein